MILIFSFQQVIKLTDKNYTNFTKEHQWTLVKFYTSWCGHCVTLKPKWEKLSTIVDIPVAEMDCGESQKTCGKLGVNSYPAMKMIEGKGVNQQYDYKGNHEVQDIAQWAEELYRVSFYVADDFDDVKLQAKSLKLQQFFVMQGASSQKVRFANFFKKFDTILFFVVAENKSLSVFQNGVKTIYKNELSDEKQLTKFILQHKLPLISQISQKSFPKLSQNTKINLILCELQKDVRDFLLKEAQTFQNRFQFGVGCEVEELQSILKQNGLQEKLKAAIFLQIKGSSQKYFAFKIESLEQLKEKIDLFDPIKLVKVGQKMKDEV